MMRKHIHEKAQHNSPLASMNTRFGSRPFDTPRSEQATFGWRPNFGHSLGEVDLFPIQPKLVVGSPEDKYEEEADQVAEQVMHPCPKCQPEEVVLQAKPIVNQIPPLMQRQEAKPEKVEEEEEEIIQPKQAFGLAPQMGPSLETQIQSLRGHGQLLPRSVRNLFEPRFGYDFSEVRIHTDAKAAESARAVNAIAYTVGRDIMFGAGQYVPTKSTGRRLIAHELAHCIQQSAVRKEKPINLTIAHPDQRDKDFSNTTAAQIEDKPPINFNKRDIKKTSFDAKVLSNPKIQRAIIGRQAPAPVAAERLAEFRRLIREYQALRGSGQLSREEIVMVDQAIARAENALREAEQSASAGRSLYTASSVALGASAVLAADDLSGIGVADDIALPFTLAAAGILAAAGWIVSRPSAEILRTGEAARDAVADVISAIGQILLAQRFGEQVRGWTAEVAIHLARFLGTTVAGRPPDHQRDPERDRPKWWDEIKNFIRQIQHRGLSPRQLLRELRKRFSDEQLTQIRDALREVARRMGEDPPNFPPAATP